VDRKYIYGKTSFIPTLFYLDQETFPDFVVSVEGLQNFASTMTLGTSGLDASQQKPNSASLLVGC